MLVGRYLRAVGRLMASWLAAGAIRLARAYTGRDQVAVCGYHGWHDWYIGSTVRHPGRRAISFTFFRFNNMVSLRSVFAAHPGEFAAVILEPKNVAYPAPGSLESVRELAHRHGALLVSDETITGSRLANGGAQERFGVAAFGKGPANGFALSALTARAEIMQVMEKIFFSSTFGGETLSLAAALATLYKLRREPVIGTLRRQSQKVIDGVQALIAEFNIGDIVAVSGDPTWSFLNVKDAAPYKSWQIKTFLLQGWFERGIQSLGTQNLSYAHSDDDIASLLSVHREALAQLTDLVRNRELDLKPRCKPPEPLFKVL